MKISLLHNPDAGNGFSMAALRREIEGAGHEIVQELEKGSDFERAGKGGADLVVIAGGDGTVRRAVHALHDAGLPLAVLPFGTANNIARALGIDGPLDELARRWDRGRRVRFDLGKVRGDWGETLFLEGVGARLIPKFMKAAKARLKKEKTKDAEAQLEIARRVFREAVETLEPRRLRMTADGIRIDGKFLMVQVLNIPSIGPALPVAPSSDLSDGVFDLVVAGEEHRDDLAALLDRKPDEPRPKLPTWHVRRVEIRACPAIHVDDELRPSAETGDVSIDIVAGKVEFLV
ncbi:MAG TPA: diacylglycerol kinase family protein [Thermoanaerobaculia bacterium]